MQNTPKGDHHTYGIHAERRETDGRRLERYQDMVSGDSELQTTCT